ncbi:hypothetical protein GCM10027435_19390 [Haloparvum alkalitolerans]
MADDADADADAGSDADADDQPSGEPVPTDLKWVGPATADAFADADLTAADVTDKRVSYRILVEAGVNPGVAAKIRREHSLSWSFEAGDGLASRSTQVRGFGDEEAAWVAASSGDWEERADAAAEERSAEDANADEAAWVADAMGGGADPAETDGSGDPTAAEAAWRERSAPTPTTDLDAVDEAAADLLAEAGITSVRSLATADPEHVADVLELDPDDVTAWYEAARRADD